MSPTPSRDSKGWKRFAVATLVALAAAGYGVRYAPEWDPAGIGHNPAAILTAIAALVAVGSMIGALRAAARSPRVTIEHEPAPSVGPGWPDGWEPANAASSDPEAIDRLGTADLEWSFRNPLPEWSKRSAP